MNILKANYIPLNSGNRHVFYRRWWKSTDDNYSHDSDINLTQPEYNPDMEFEADLNSFLVSMSIKEMNQSIDSVRSECNVSQLHQISIVRNALSLLLNSNKLLTLLDQSPFDVYKADDNVILIEWSFKNLGLGFCLAPDSSSSGWYLTSNEKAGNILRSGLLTSDQEINNSAALMISLLQEHIEELNL